MAAFIVRVIPEGSVLCRSSISGFSLATNGYQGIRSLFSPSALGIDGYIRSREKTKSQFANLTEKFKTKMTEFSEPKSSNMIFTEDLKNMVHLAEGNADDVNLVYKMIKKFTQQNKEIRFGSYIFGPVVMRMYYMLNKPDEALAAFKDPDLEAFFAQLSTYQILMDLLYENEMYQEILDIFEIVKGRQHQDSKFPKNVVILTLAACYKVNTPESYKYGMDLWKELKEVGHIPMRRAVTFAACLALNHNAPHIALEIISDVQQQNYVTVRNIKAIALADVGRPEDALLILRSLIDADIPSQRKQTVSTDVIEKVRAAVEKAGNKETALEFAQLEKRLSDGGHITKVSMDEQLCSQISELPRNQNEDRNRGFLAASFNRQDSRNRTRAYARPGLKDMY